MFRFQLHYYSNNVTTVTKETLLMIDTRERLDRHLDDLADDLDDQEMKDPLEKAIQSKYVFLQIF